MPTSTPDWGAFARNTKRREEVLITVKAYPNPSAKYIETVCVAGVTKSGQWIRLYPFPYRFMRDDQRFPTYSWIEVEIFKAQNDHRPESYHIEEDSVLIKEVPRGKNIWNDRRALLLPLASQSVEQLREQQDTHGTSLGMIRPKQIKQLIIKSESSEWSPRERAKLGRNSLFDPVGEDGNYKTVTPLEKIPFSFFYQFTCDDPRCTGHTMSVISWEVMQSYRKWRRNYGDSWKEKFLQKYAQELPSPTRDLYFFLGTVSTHPKDWLIIGLFYPPSLSVATNSPSDQQGTLIQPKLLF